MYTHTHMHSGSKSENMKNSCQLHISTRERLFMLAAHQRRRLLAAIIASSTPISHPHGFLSVCFSLSPPLGCFITARLARGSTMGFYVIPPATRAMERFH